MSGPSQAHDPRLTAARRDLADVRLADRIFAPHYAVATPCGVVVAAPLIADGKAGDVISEVLPGERFEVLEHGGERVWGIAADGTVGYVAAEALGPAAEPTHAVAVAVAEPRGGGTPLPMGARLSGTVSGGVLEADCGTYDLVDLRPVERPLRNSATAAGALVGITYKPGGRSGAGLDAAGLVYLSLTEAGHACPRYIEQQAEIGETLAADADLQPGDLVVFADHIGLVAEGGTLIHATPTGVARLPLRDVVDAGTLGPIADRRRP